jgi:hypothetical protein
MECQKWRRKKQNGAAVGGICLTSSPERAAMLSGAQQRMGCRVNVIMRVFVDLRKFLSTNLELAHKVEELYRAQREHGAHIDAIWEAIHQMVEAHAEPKRRIGFQLPSAS